MSWKKEINSLSRTKKFLLAVFLFEVALSFWVVAGWNLYFVAHPQKILISNNVVKPKVITPPAESSIVPAPVSKKPTTTTPTPVTSPVSSGVEVRGDVSCQQQVGAALSMLQSGAPDHYALANKYLSYIECAAVGSSIDGTAKYVHFTMGQATLEAGTLWVAGIIAHEYCHPMLYHQRKVWEGEQGESSCLEVQYDALSKMGADQDLLDYVKNLAETRWWEDPNDWW